MNDEIDSLMAKQIELALNYHKTPQKLALSVSLIPC